LGTTRGDVILLDGDLGAGKTCFSRGFVRARTGIPDLTVTSPTYLLCNTYLASDSKDAGRPGIRIHHMDLYRLSGKEEELRPLDLSNVFTNDIALMEWPSRLGSKMPVHRLDIHLRICGDDDKSKQEDGNAEDTCTRQAALLPHGPAWEQRLQFLLDEGYLDDLLQKV